MRIDASDLCFCLDHFPDTKGLDIIDGNTKGLQIFGKLICSGRAGDRNYIARLRHLPGQNKLGQGATFAIGILLKLVDKVHIGVPISGHETGMSQADVTSGNAAR